MQIFGKYSFSFLHQKKKIYIYTYIYSLLYIIINCLLNTQTILKIWNAIDYNRMEKYNLLQNIILFFFLFLPFFPCFYIFHLFSRTVNIKFHIWNILTAHYFNILLNYSYLIPSRWHWTRFSHYPNKTQNIRCSMSRNNANLYRRRKSKINEAHYVRCILFFF